MAKVMKQTSVIALVLTLAFCFLFGMTSNSVIFSLAITFATIAYHLFVFIQRFNRARIRKIIEKEKLRGE